MKKIESTGIVLDADNIDTDQIIPAKFLKSTSREGFGEHLFSNWRYLENGEANTDFALYNYPSDAAILISGNNFGCGSSREHAAWAISDYGIRAVISSQFADIFKGNALNNDIIPIVLSTDEITAIMRYVEQHPSAKINIDIDKQSVQIEEEGFSFFQTFQIDQLKKKFIMEDIKDLEYMLSIKEEIAQFELAHIL
ncbi:MAG: 3-isopropylmalate dehydratase small subunit [Crocinitomicaceae bacterium]|nr:3-isopropylmalate dehydratase small subunit [Crocinitomicaceae bacterium]